jgi:probable F420-dependent oxidoreductase
MKIDTAFRDPDLTTAARHAQRLEALGFDCLWGIETAHDPFLPLAIAAAHTERVNLGTNIAVAFARTPYVTATIAWDLQAWSKGRFFLGLGTQVRPHVERRFSMPFDRPTARIKDYIRCVRAIWDTFQHGSKPAYEGEFYRFTVTNPAFTPAPLAGPMPPIYMAGVNALMCRAAGEVADGFQVHSFNSAAYLRDVVRANLDQGARLQGKTVDDFSIYATVFVVTGETQAEWDRLERDVRSRIAFYASTPSYRAVLEYHGFDGIAKELSRLSRIGEWEQMTDMITDEMLETFAVVAKPAELPRAMRERYAGLATRVAMSQHVLRDDPDARWRQLTDGIHAG